MDKGLSDPKLLYIYSLLMIIIIVLLTSGKHFSYSRVLERDDKGWKSKVTDHIGILKRYLLYWVLYVLSKQDYKLISYNYFKEELFLMSSPSLEISRRGVRLGKRTLTLNKKEEEKTGPRAPALPRQISGHNAEEEKVLERKAFQQQPPGRASSIG